MNSPATVEINSTNNHIFYRKQTRKELSVDIQIKSNSGSLHTINATHMVYANIAVAHGHVDKDDVYHIIVSLALAGF